jgi:hypothetical protein
VFTQLESSHRSRPTRVSTATGTVAGTFRLNVTSGSVVTVAHPVSLLRRAITCAAALALVAGFAALTAPAASAAPAAPGRQITFYVSPGGSDANPGTSSAHPVRTLARASGQNSLPVCVYGASAALQADKTVTRVVLCRMLARG